MTPIDQLAEIIRMLSPNDTNQTDAVFLLKQYMERMQFNLQKANKAINRLQGQVEDAQTSLHNVINDKLEKDLAHKEKIAQLEMELNEKVPGSP
jgi:predicted  nucleic acid-binding Zn-ribbon protein